MVALAPRLSCWSLEWCKSIRAEGPALLPASARYPHACAQGSRQPSYPLSALPCALMELEVQRFPGFNHPFLPSMLRTHFLHCVEKPTRPIFKVEFTNGFRQSTQHQTGRGGTWTVQITALATWLDQVLHILKCLIIPTSLG